jgi:hypothetical protein
MNKIYNPNQIPSQLYWNGKPTKETVDDIELTVKEIFKEVQKEILLQNTLRFLMTG